MNTQCTLNSVEFILSSEYRNVAPPQTSFLPMAALTPILLHLHPSYLTSYLSPQICYILSYIWPSCLILNLFPHLGQLFLSCSLSYALESCFVLSLTWKIGGTAFNLIIFNNCSKRNKLTFFLHERFSFIFVMFNQPDITRGVLQPH